MFNIRKGILLFAAIMMLVAPFYILSTPKPAHAQVCLLAAGGWVLGLFGLHTAVTDAAKVELMRQIPLSVPVNSLALGGFDTANSMGQVVNGSIEAITAWKECVLDPLLWMAKSIIIEAITTAIVDWINSGFEGGPVFVTDLDGFLLDVADRVAGDFITDAGLGFLCSPYIADIQLRLLLSYYSEWGSEGTYCKLSDVVENIENFIAGNFFDGGWVGWMQMSMYPNGNPNGSFLNAAAELDWRIGNKVGEENNLLARAFNYLSPRNPFGNIKTPGRYVEQALNSWTNSPLGQLEVADEVDEIVGALFTYLVQEILTGDGGLRGASDGYTDRIRDGQRQSCVTLQQDLVEQINALIAAEQAAGRTEFTARLNDLLARAQAVQCTLFPDDTVTLRQIQAEMQALKSEMDAKKPVCSDLIDNDGDGKTDYPTDPGCTNANDTDETDGGTPEPPPPPSACNDGLDNDGDGATDYPADTGCANAEDTTETDDSGGPPTTLPPTPLAQCADALDNDGDNSTDYPSDLGCASASDNDENDSAAPASQCTDGIDNDGDGKIDYPTDPGCTSNADNDETDEGGPPPPPPPA